MATAPANRSEVLTERELIAKWRKQADTGERLAKNPENQIECSAIWAFRGCADELEVTLSDLEKSIASEVSKASDCRAERYRKGDSYQVKYWGGFLDALGFVGLKLQATAKQIGTLARSEASTEVCEKK